ncbi:type VI secretion system lipoprotein TssJ [Thiocystis violacea]|uniref:type VI secretion system lipoprotein TssJ n=1 Tax=Thiocystis violacea TaxID=13725 RepID=UPI0019035790|nr:type VI secretion system lipoprotein TssJ [Thiocystis violacea]MBK1717787.1 type VI secretion system-associated lipoprotein [Thiocystis violacea]
MTTSQRRRVFLVALLATAIPFAGGCAKKPEVKEVKEVRELKAEEKKPPPRLSIEIRAANDANLGPGGRGLPVVARVYELKSLGVFASADFFSLYDHETEVLGGDLLARDEVTLAPGQFLPLERLLDTDAAYVGVVAAFRDIDQSQWRESLRLKPDVDNKILIEIGAKAVSIRHQ